MCRVIGEALQRKGKPDAHPSDYLNFYAIANRQKSADPDLKYNKGAQKAGASPDKSFIHVHAKVIAEEICRHSIVPCLLNCLFCIPPPSSQGLQLSLPEQR